MQIKEPNFRNLMAIAAPMMVSQASETIMLFVDRLFLSWLGTTHISAAMSGGLSAFVMLSLFTGTVGYVNALSAQYFGAREEKNCVKTVFQGGYLALLCFPLALLLIPLMGRFFNLVGHTPAQVALEFQYFRLLMLGGIFALLRTVFGGFFMGIGKTRIVMYANLAGMVINIPVNYVLIFGKFGFPALGITGAAIGTISGSFLIALILLIAFLRHKLYRTHRSESVWRPDKKVMGKLLRFGSPAGLEMFLNVLAFNIFVQMFHSYSEEVAAAVTIAFNYDMVAFIPMLGIGFAVTSVVGQQMGAGNPAGAEKAAKLALRVGLVYGAAMMLLFFFGADGLVGIFTRGLSGEEAAGLTVMAKTMLRMAALYTVADMVQVIMGGALRGAGDTRWVMMLSASIHWLMAGAGWLLIKRLAVNPVLAWLCFILFVLVMGATLSLRFKFGPWRSMRVVD